jgi:hypothetical protein
MWGMVNVHLDERRRDEMHVAHAGRRPAAHCPSMPHLNASQQHGPD